MIAPANCLTARRLRASSFSAKDLELLQKETEDRAFRAEKLLKISETENTRPPGCRFGCQVYYTVPETGPLRRAVVCLQHAFFGIYVWKQSCEPQLPATGSPTLLVARQVASEHGTATILGQVSPALAWTNESCLGLKCFAELTLSTSHRLIC